MKSVIPTLQRVATFSTGLARPATACGRQQLAILVRDASSSMSGEKAREADAASRALAAELAAPARRGAFTIPGIGFSHAGPPGRPPAARGPPARPAL